MKKGIVKLLTVFISVAYLIMPSFTYAQISGFDYTNYYELNYIQGDGSSGYINTGIKPDRNVIVEAKFEKGTSGYYAGVNSSGGTTGYYTIYTNDSKLAFRIVTSTLNSLDGQFTSGAFTVTVNPRSGITATDGTTTYSKNLSTSNSTAATKNMYILANNNQGSAASFGDHKVYYFYTKSYSTGEYTHKWIPAERISDGKLGMYDTVTSTFTAASGTVSSGGHNLPSYTITTDVSPSGSGSVSQSGNGTYQYGDTVTVTATAASGYVFDHWSDNTSTNPKTVLVTSDLNLTAYFTESVTPITYTVSASVDPAGSGTVSGTGTYNNGETCNLTATPSSGYVFDHWNTGSTANPLSFTVGSSVSYTAYFEEESQVTSYTVTIISDPGLGGSTTGAGTYVSGNNATLTATPATNYIFKGWYINNVQVSTSATYTFLVESNVTVYAKFQYVDPDPSTTTWTPWTDSDDSLTLSDVTTSYDYGDFSMVAVRTLVVDQFINQLQGLEFDSSYGGNLAIVGTYSPEGFQAVTACNSTSYEHTNTTFSPSEEIVINPFIVGNLGVSVGVGYGNLQYGIEITDSNVSGTSSTTTSITNTSQACTLMGYGDGDSNIDASMWDTLGYHALTTYSDVSGVEATVYMPNNRDIDLEIDLDSFFDDLKAYANNINFIIYHYEYDIYLNADPGIVMPRYGYLKSHAALGSLLSYGLASPVGNYLDNSLYKYQILSDSDEFKGTGSISSTTATVEGTANTYKGSSEFYWYDTDKPHWHFKEARFYSSALPNLSTTTNSESYINLLMPGSIQNYMTKHVSEGGSFYTITSSDVSENSWYTEGNKMVVNGFYEMKMYNLHDNSLLNRFNQLGEFLNRWFNKLYNSISNITGGSESNDITNNIINDYDVDVDNDFNLIIGDLTDANEEIDLTLPAFTVDDENSSNVEMLSDIPLETIKVFTDNKLGFLIFVPIVIAVLRLIL